VAAESAPPAPADPALAAVVEEMLELLGNAMEGRQPAPTDTGNQDADTDVDLDDVSHLMLPETQPELQVLLEARDWLQRMAQRQDLDANERLQLMLLLVRHLPVFRYVLRPAGELMTEPARAGRDTTTVRASVPAAIQQGRSCGAYRP
jgi:hypothetical protein